MQGETVPRAAARAPGSMRSPRRVPLLLASALGLTLLLDVLIRLTGGYRMTVVMLTYIRGGAAFRRGADPYAATLRYGAPGQFLYSPFFAMLTAPLASVHPLLVARLFLPFWTWLNSAVFWLGTLVWPAPRRLARGWLLAAGAACFLELDASMRFLQINALVVGLILLGLASFREGKQFTAGAVLMLAANLKVFPVIFLAGLLPLANRRYLAGLALCGAATFLAPALAVGAAANWADHLAWAGRIARDTVGAGVLDVSSAFARIGFPVAGRALRLLLLAASAVAFAAESFRDDVRWEAWFTLGITSLLLVNPRTEVPTFVLCAPAYLLLLRAPPENGLKNPRSRLEPALLLFGMFSISLCSNRFNDRDWGTSERPERILRVAGVAALWSIALRRLARRSA